MHRRRCSDEPVPTPSEPSLTRSGGCLLTLGRLMLGAMDEQATPPHFEIHLKGLLGDTVRDAFPEMHARRQRHETVLAGALPDQAALHGVLARIEALGLELLEIRRVRGDYPPPADASRPSATRDAPPCHTLAAGSTPGRRP